MSGEVFGTMQYVYQRMCVFVLCKFEVLISYTSIGIVMALVVLLY